ncbi:lysozyme C-like [Anomaloglossus baeobatrachus]|uniref:lysozyme C-like n=1 Tax=Anomaloglossus baeobatrachus TaxID=238106 RepID=UPI003F4FAF1D
MTERNSRCPGVLYDRSGDRDLSPQHFNMKIIIVLIFAAVADISWATSFCSWITAFKKYTKDENVIANLMCIIDHGSGFNKDNKNVDNTYGAFWLNSQIWCDDCETKTENFCKMRCADLLDDNLDDDAKCVVQIAKTKGFTPWKSTWESKCKDKDLSKYLK